jgi:hypothetical protein
LTQEFAEEISLQIEERLDIPFLVPTVVVVHFLTQVMEKLVTAELSDKTITAIQEVLQAEATPYVEDDVDETTIQKLVKDVAKELNAKIDVPLLTEEQELAVLETILQLVFTNLTITKADRNEFLAEQETKLSRNLSRVRRNTSSLGDSNQ